MISLHGRRDLGKGTLVNLTSGGEGGKGLIFSKEHRRKLSEVNKGKKLSKETRRKISEAGKGVVPSKETRNKLSKANGKIVYQYSKEGLFLNEFSSTILASKETGVNRGDLNSCCNGKLKTAGGYIWRYNKTIY
jgi:hypothetical protein